MIYRDYTTSDSLSYIAIALLIVGVAYGLSNLSAKAFIRHYRFVLYTVLGGLLLTYISTLLYHEPLGNKLDPGQAYMRYGFPRPVYIKGVGPESGTKIDFRYGTEVLLLYTSIVAAVIAVASGLYYSAWTRQ